MRQGAVAASARMRYVRHNAPVAQLDRALPSEGRGQGFESLRARHFLAISELGVTILSPAMRAGSARYAVGQTRLRRHAPDRARQVRDGEPD